MKFRYLHLIKLRSKSGCTMRHHGKFSIEVQRVQISLAETPIKLIMQKVAATTTTSVCHWRLAGSDTVTLRWSVSARLKCLLCVVCTVCGMAVMLDDRDYNER